ncbi:MAG: type II toxin-antitoxin system RelE/ParE family toxin [Thermoanaerobaculia bacterium]|nr:type II toxin-antitoxin system RelE/ParE family toxin [Thermoanaerobaculia bacterium]
MGNDRIRIAESVEKQWQDLGESERYFVRDAFTAIDDDPIIGTPLFEPFQGLWSCRVDGLRIVYRIVPEARFVVILAIARVKERLPR